MFIILEWLYCNFELLGKEGYIHEDQISQNNSYMKKPVVIYRNNDLSFITIKKIIM